MNVVTARKTFSLALGRYLVADILGLMIETSGCRVGTRAKCLLCHEVLPLTSIKTVLKLVVLQLGDLGFKEAVSYQQICARLLGTTNLTVCPPETGPVLRERYQSQPPGEKLHIAMAHIKTLPPGHGIFTLGNDLVDGRWLDYMELELGRFNSFEPQDLFVFRFIESK